MPVSRAQGGFLGSIRMSEELAARRRERVPAAPVLQRGQRRRAHADDRARRSGGSCGCTGLTPDAFVAGVGTGGTVMGVGRYLRAQNPAVRVHPLEPAESPTIRHGHKVGQHRIQGISDEFIPAIVKLDELEPVIEASDGDAIIMAQKLANAGLAVGISSGANFIGALKIQDAIGHDAVVATVFSDSNKKYLSTDLMRTEAVKPGYLAPDTEVLGFDAMKRVCAMCCDDPECASEHARIEEQADAAVIEGSGADRSYRCTRPLWSPPARRSTSAALTRLKSPGMVCLSALAATANRSAASGARPVDQAVDEARGEAVASADAVHNRDVVVRRFRWKAPAGPSYSTALQPLRLAE